MKQSPMEEALREIYYDPSHPAGYSGVDKLHNAVKKRFPNVKKTEVKKWLTKQDTYTLHKKSRRRYPRNRVFVSGIDDQWQADLVDLSAYAQYNKGFKWLLTCIDIFSKSAWAIPLKNKSGSTLLNAFQTLFKDSGRLPRNLQTDKGSEFYNRLVKTFLKEKGVHLFSTENETKASVVERFNRTLKTKMWRYFTANSTYKYMDVLPSLLESYNTTHHRTIDRAPDEVNEKNELEVWKTMYGKSKKKQKKRRSKHMKSGDMVRLSMVTRPFRKGYLPRWTEEVFLIDKVIHRTPIVYAVKDLEGEAIAGTFYGEELQKIESKDSETLYKIEKIIRSRKRKDGTKEYLVKWYGYPSKFNSWVTDVVKA